MCFVFKKLHEIVYHNLIQYINYVSIKLEIFFKKRKNYRRILSHFNILLLQKYPIFATVLTWGDFVPLGTFCILYFWMSQLRDGEKSLSRERRKQR